MAKTYLNNKNVRRLLFLMAISLFSAAAIAGERYEFYNGIRMMGMGGAGIAVVNDETAIYTNPAALGKLRDYFITVADPELSLGLNTQPIVGTSIFTPFNPKALEEKLVLSPDKHLHVRAQISPSIVVPNFGFGVISKYEVNAEYKSATNVHHVEYRNDDAFTLAYNFRFFDGRVKVGFNARAVNRIDVNADLTPPSVDSLSYEDLAKEGLGISSDVGIILTAPWQWLPTLAAVYRDAGRTSYNFKDGLYHNTTERPDSTPATLDGAFALFPILGKKTRFTFTGEYRDIMNVYEEEGDVMRRIHGGMEFNIADALFIRAGWNQHYWTAGLELSMANYQLQFATYGEEIGTPTLRREDRRYMGKFAYRF